MGVELQLKPHVAVSHGTQKVGIGRVKLKARFADRFEGEPVNVNHDLDLVVVANECPYLEQCPRLISHQGEFRVYRFVPKRPGPGLVGEKVEREGKALREVLRAEEERMGRRLGLVGPVAFRFGNQKREVNHHQHGFQTGMTAFAKGGFRLERAAGGDQAWNCEAGREVVESIMLASLIISYFAY